MNNTALPERPWCTPAEAARFIKAMTGESESSFYNRLKRGNFPVREIATRKVLSTKLLKEMYAEASVG